MKTAMEEMLDFIKSTDDISMCLIYATKLIEKEKQQIIEAYDSSIRNGVLSSEKGLWRGQEYYKETFNK